MQPNNFTELLRSVAANDPHCVIRTPFTMIGTGAMSRQNQNIWDAAMTAIAFANNGVSVLRQNQQIKIEFVTDHSLAEQSLLFNALLLASQEAEIEISARGRR